MTSLIQLISALFCNRIFFFETQTTSRTYEYIRRFCFEKDEEEENGMEVRVECKM